MDVPEIERIQAIRLEPEDRLVIKLPDNTPREQAEHIRSLLAERFDVSIDRVLVFAGSVEFEIVRSGV